MNHISDLIQTYLSSHKDSDFEVILNAFMPLIKKYSGKLYYLEFDDCVQELSVELFLSLPKIKKVDDEYSCLSYINKAIVHKFCKLYSISEQEEKIKKSTVTDTEYDVPVHETSYDDAIFHLDISLSLNEKSNTEKEILLYLLQSYSDTEISKKLNLSRQYINRIKKTLL